MPAVACLTDSELVQLVDGSLPREAAVGLDAHLDDCARCFAVVASLLRGQSGPTARNALPAPLAPEDLAFLDGPRLFGRRYLLQAPIGQGGMGQVYRAVDRLTGQAVALKRVFRRTMGSSSGGSGASSELQPDAYASCLEREFRILATLRHPHIISVLDYGFEEARRPFYTMELLVGARPILPLARDLPPAERLELLIQLLHALGYLHRRSVLHRDIKPTNLLVFTDGNGRRLLKVLDFGLSSGPEGVPLAALGGTLGYMAPELLRGAPPNEASDLYAVGVVAYELLVGGHPFSTAAATSRLLFGVLHEAPDLSSLPPALADVLGRTLSKRPEDRPANVASLLRELCTAAGIAPPSAPPAVRDSFLVAARFVGRESELTQLTQALASARAGSGSLWLLGGESGAGKSRLMEELRSVALPEGVLVLRGQAIQSGGTAYQLWRDALRLLALHIELSPHEIALLSAVVTDLAALLERPVAKAPLAEPHGLGARLLRAMHEVLQRVAIPTLVLLEDLQWADAESLTLLAQLGEKLRHQPMLIVASYREEEARNLPASLPAAQPLLLSRLDRGGIKRLCESILGSAAMEPRLLDLVERETEGNSYFLIEWLRALAVDTGTLDALAVSELPRGFLPGGVAEVLTRRLSRVPAPAEPLLRVAAVAGRRLDLGLLRSLWPQLEALMQSAVEAGVLEAHGLEWRFSHDKLRERILAGLDTDSRRALHLQVAHGLAAIYAEDHSHAAAIAYHFEEAQQQGLAAHHYVLAGEFAFHRGAPSEAEGHFAKAVALNELLGTERRTRIKAWSGLSQARYALGKLKETVDALQPMFALAGAPLPAGQGQIAIDLVAQLYQLLTCRVGSAWRGRPAAVDEEEREVLETMRQALASQEVFIWMVRPDLFALCNVRSLYLEAVLATPPAERHLSSWVLFMFGVPQLRPLVKRWLRRDPRRLEFTGWPTVNFYRQAAMLWMNLGDGRAAAQAAEQAVTLAQAMRDDHALILSLFQLQLAQIALEDFTKVLAISQELAQLASRLQNRRYLTIGLLGQAMAWMRFGEFALATPTLEQARLAVPSEFGIMPQAMVVGQSALCALRLDEQDKAELLAGEAMAVIDQIKWAILPMTHALTHVLEVYLTIANGRAYVGAMEKLIAHLAEIAGRFPYAGPRALFYRGRYELWRNNPRRARLYLQRSLRAAQDVRLQYEEAQAQEWLGRLASQLQWGLRRGPDPVEHLRAAQTYYQRTGARWELARLRRDFPHLA